jgi:hypothetical protein
MARQVFVMEVAAPVRWLLKMCNKEDSCFKKPLIFKIQQHCGRLIYFKYDTFERSAEMSPKLPLNRELKYNHIILQRKFTLLSTSTIIH